MQQDESVVDRPNFAKRNEVGGAGDVVRPPSHGCGSKGDNPGSTTRAGATSRETCGHRESPASAPIAIALASSASGPGDARSQLSVTGGGRRPNARQKGLPRGLERGHTLCLELPAECFDVDTQGSKLGEQLVVGRIDSCHEFTLALGRDVDVVGLENRAA